MLVLLVVLVVLLKEIMSARGRWRGKNRSLGVSTARNPPRGYFSALHRDIFSSLPLPPTIASNNTTIPLSSLPQPLPVSPSLRICATVSKSAVRPFEESIPLRPISCPFPRPDSRARHHHDITASASNSSALFSSN